MRVNKSIHDPHTILTTINASSFLYFDDQSTNSELKFFSSFTFHEEEFAIGRECSLYLRMPVSEETFDSSYVFRT